MGRLTHSHRPTPADVNFHAALRHRQRGRIFDGASDGGDDEVRRVAPRGDIACAEVVVGQHAKHPRGYAVVLGSDSDFEDVPVEARVVLKDAHGDDAYMKELAKMQLLGFRYIDDR